MKNGICYIVGAGAFKEEIAPCSTDYLIAADGGYDNIDRKKHRIDAVMGDFDSLGRVPDHPNLIRHPAEKDDTDMMLAVSYAYELGYRKFLLFGGLGGRLDHTLANLQTLLWISENHASGYLIGEGMIIGTVTDSEYLFTGAESGILSIFPAYNKASGVYLTNLKYTLDNAVLNAARALAVSNEFIGLPAKVRVDSGTLLMLWYENFEDRKGAVYENWRRDI